MVTGDHYLTAQAVAQVTGMLNYKRKHVHIAQLEGGWMHESIQQSPSVSSIEKVVSPPLDRLGQPLRTKSALPAGFASAMADLVPDTSSSFRSSSLNKIDSASAKLQPLSGVSRSKLSSKPLVPKPALPSSPRDTLQASQLVTDRPALLPNELTQSGQQRSQITTQTAKASSQPDPKAVQTDLSVFALAHARSHEPYFFDQLTAQGGSSVSESVLLDPTLALDSADEEPSPIGLSCFVVEDGHLMPLGCRDAYALIAEGHQCTITGSVFAYLLQHAEPTLLETVLRNVAVCARMKSHQKAQLVQLLGTHGLTVSSNRRLKVS